MTKVFQENNNCDFKFLFKSAVECDQRCCSNFYNIFKLHFYEFKVQTIKVAQSKNSQIRARINLESGMTRQLQCLLYLVIVMLSIIAQKLFDFQAFNLQNKVVYEAKKIKMLYSFPLW